MLDKDGVDNLLNAIVELACRDYMDYKVYGMRKHDSAINYYSALSFFKSDQCKSITSVNLPETLDDLLCSFKDVARDLYSNGVRITKKNYYNKIKIENKDYKRYIYYFNKQLEEVNE